MPRSTKNPKSFNIRCRICVITFLRIIWLQTWDLTDLTHTVAPGSIWSTLEPSLGIVNACLPVMVPVIRKIFGKDRPALSTWGGNTGESSTQRRWYGNGEGSKDVINSDTKNFQRITHSTYELDGLRTDPKQINHSQNSDVSEYEVVPLVPGVQNDKSGNNSIILTREWNVESVWAISWGLITVADSQNHLD